MKYANEISKEALWEHFSWHFSKHAGLPERCSRCGGSLSEGDSFAHAGLQASVKDMRPGQVPCCFLFHGSIFLLHKSVAPAKWKAR